MIHTFPARAAWLAARSGKITGTKAAAILGVSAFGGPWSVYRREVEGHEEQIDAATQAMFDRGHLLEPLAINAWERARDFEGLTILRGHEQEIGVTREDLPRWFASPDALVLREDGTILGGCEVKSVSRSDLGRFWDDDDPEPAWVRDLNGRDVGPGQQGEHVPIGWLCQILAYMEVCRAEWWDLTVIGPHIDQTAILRIFADANKQRGIVRDCDEWWEEHVVGRLPPEVDDSDDCYQAIRAAWPARSGAVDMGEDFDEIAAAYLDARDEIRRAQGRQKLARARMLDLMGPAQRAVSPNHTVSFNGAIRVNRR